MIPLNSKKLFQKEPRIIIRTVGRFYAVMGAWCLFAITLITIFQKNDEDFNKFNQTIDILQNIWTTYMPSLIVIGLSMIVFSYIFERFRKHSIVIQKVILFVCTIWGFAYSVACIPYLETFQSISSEKETFNGLTYLVTILGLGFVLAIMIVPNLRALRKMKTEKTDI